VHTSTEEFGRVLMRKSNRTILLVVAALLLVYAAAAFSPIKYSIGRYDPAIAAWFSPMLFNFSHTYREGPVLEFNVGMSKAELFSTLTGKYMDRADLTVNCRVTTASSVVPISRDLDFRAAYGCVPRLCVRLDSRKLAADFEFQNDAVSAIVVSYIRNESL
jgi:hypothetical protein